MCVRSCEGRVLLQSSGGGRQMSVNDQRDKTTAGAGDQESGGACFSVANQLIFA